MDKFTHLDWETLETPHLKVHYQKGLEELAGMAARYGEESHQILSPLVDWEPKDKVHLIISDIKDEQDGNAVNFPYPILRLFPNAPDISSPIAEYESGDWLRALILHEYFHILHLDTVAGYSKWLREAFGRPGFAPNAKVNGAFLALNGPNNFAPFWLWEGLAVYFETELTHSGRGKSPQSEMIFRLAALEDKFTRLDQLDFFRPGGMHAARYLYGAYYVNYLANLGDNRFVRDMNHDIAKLPPYWGILFSPANQKVGGEYENFIEFQRQVQMERVAILQTQEFTPIQSMREDGYLQKTFALSPDETSMAYVDHSGDWGIRFMLLDLKTGSRKKISTQDASSAVWHPEGRHLFYTSVHAQGLHAFRDLHVYDSQTETTLRLTTSARLGDIDISPDGRKLIGVEYHKGHQNLVLYDIQKNDDSFNVMKKLGLTNYVYHRVATPQWNHKGDKVAFSLTDRQGKTSMVVLALANGQELLKIEQGHLQATPRWEPEDQGLLFSSDHSGVSNIYRYDFNSGTLSPVTHVMGGAYMPLPAIQSGKLFFQNYTTNGLELASTQWHPGMRRSQQLPVITPTWRYSSELSRKRDESVSHEIEASPKPYDSMHEFTQQFWFPYAELEDDTYVPGVITSGEDPLQNHAWYGVLAKGQYWYHRLAYTNDQLNPTLSLSSSLLPRAYVSPAAVPKFQERYHEASLTASKTTEEGVALSASLLYSHQQPFEGTEFTATMNLRHRSQIAGFTLKPLDQIPELYHDPKDYFSKRTFTGRRVGFSASLGYGDSYHYPLSIQDENGFGFSTSFTMYPETWGSNPKLRVLASQDFDKRYQEVGDLNPDEDQFTIKEENILIENLRNDEIKLSNTMMVFQANMTRFFPLFWKHHVLKLDVGLGHNLNQNETLPAFYTKYNILIRGYRNHLETAQSYQASNLEWDFPITEVFRGIGLLPFYFRLLHGALFYDYSQFDGKMSYSDVIVSNQIFYMRTLESKQIRRSTGFELRLLSRFGLRFPINLILRFAYATDIQQIAGAEEVDPFWIEFTYGMSF
ncbi:MAG: hypothetical protein HQM12_19215 [SAR324 cluster bacterium]|nr:hypothetical protein [SAR324 cluster bacterium]